MAKASAPSKAQLAVLGSNLEGDDGDDGGDEARCELPSDPIEQPRVRIQLEENENIPPTGQFFGAQGRGYILRPGEPADVPQSIINILDTSVESHPVKDASDVVIGYRDRLRYPYRVVVPARRPA